MNNLIRIIVATLISLTFSVGIFAADSDKDTASGKVQSGTMTEIEKVDEEREEQKEAKEEVTEAKKEKIKQEISSYIIDSYKAQGDKILKDIDQTLLKNKPKKEDRIDSYKSIKFTLEARRIRNNEQNKTNEISQIILYEFLTHMIDSIEKKISELSK